MKAKEKREIAIRAARSQLRKLNAAFTLDNAECVLDEMATSEPQLIASQWFVSASNNQWKLFCREWENANSQTWN